MLSVLFNGKPWDENAMRNNFYGLALLGFICSFVVQTFLNAAMAASEYPDQKRIPTYEQLKRELPPYPLHQLHALDDDDVKKITQGVLNNFDGRCLSNKDCYVIYSVIYTNKAVPVYKKISSKNDTPMDDFYCEQAIWEYIMGGPPLKEMLYKFSADMGSKHPELVQAQSENIVSLHLIPQFFPASEVLLPGNFLTSNTNVLRLKVEKLNDTRLTQFREEWYPVWETPTSPQKILEKSLEIRRKYSDLFF